MKNTLLAAALLCTTTAHASNMDTGKLSESKVTAGYSSLSVDSSSTMEPTFNGLSVSIGQQLQNNFYGQLGYQELNDDIDVSGVTVDTEFKRVDLRFGKQLDIDNASLWYLEAGYMFSKVEASAMGSSGESTDNEFVAAIGYKRALTDAFVVDAGVEYFDSSAALTTSVQFSVSNALALSASFSASEDYTQLGLNVVYFIGM
ncbi:outer membrane protein [Idiomarina tyrosinivorans]|nr:outer membrane beta-barrel protein [Idiomarina tyrosinivorans]